MRRLSNFGQNRFKIQKFRFQKRYASLLLVSTTTFPAWNNSKPRHIATHFPLTHKDNLSILLLRKSNVLSFYTPSSKKRVLIIHFIIFSPPQIFMLICEPEGHECLLNKRWKTVKINIIPPKPPLGGFVLCIEIYFP